MDYHILNGMCLYENFPNHIKGERIVMHEALLQGPLGGDLPMDEFWQMRANYWKVPLTNYTEKVVSPLEKLILAKKEDTLFFWFGSDLFCQINIWFLLHFIHQHKITSKTGIIYPPKEIAEDSFGHYPSSFLAKKNFKPVFMNETEIKIAIILWNLCKKGDTEGLRKLEVDKNEAFPEIMESIKLWIDLFPKNGLGIAYQKVEALMKQGILDFKELFKTFSTSFPTLGMSDRQVYEYYQTYLNKINNEK
ncbi:MAG: hypothetical protein RLZZ417_1555 [Bacteroidota bacterium]